MQLIELLLSNPRAADLAFKCGYFIIAVLVLFVHIFELRSVRKSLDLLTGAVLKLAGEEQKHESDAGLEVLTRKPNGAYPYS